MDALTRSDGGAAWNRLSFALELAAPVGWMSREGKHREAQANS